APAAAAATASAAAAKPRKLHGSRRQSGGFLVEDVECRQADVGDFLFAKNDLLIGADVGRRHGGGRCTGRCCGAPGKQGMTRCSHSRHGVACDFSACGFVPSLLLGRLLRTWHTELPQCLTAICRSACLSYARKNSLARSKALPVG